MADHGFGRGRDARAAGGARPPTRDPVREVGRPRGAAWRALQADGIVWEGQAALVGGGADLPVRLIVTLRRVALARDGEVVLDAQRAWLRPAPVLLGDGILALSVAPDGTGAAETLHLRIADGRPAASHLASLLAPNGARLVASEGPAAAPRRDVAPDRRPRDPWAAAGWEPTPERETGWGRDGGAAPSDRLGTGERRGGSPPARARTEFVPEGGAGRVDNRGGEPVGRQSDRAAGSGAPPPAGLFDDPAPWSDRPRGERAGRPRPQAAPPRSSKPAYPSGPLTPP